jgi:hypothetical protein
MKVGDKVIIICHGYGQENKIAEIERETKKYWVVDRRKYNKNSLRLAGGVSFTSSYIREYNEEDAKEIKKSNLVRYIEHYAEKLSEYVRKQEDIMTIEQLAKIVKYLKETINKIKSRK